METAFYKYKKILSGLLTSRTFENQKVEALLGCHILYIFKNPGMPDSPKKSMGEKEPYRKFTGIGFVSSGKAYLGE